MVGDLFLCSMIETDSLFLLMKIVEASNLSSLLMMDAPDAPAVWWCWLCVVSGLINQQQRHGRFCEFSTVRHALLLCDACMLGGGGEEVGGAEVKSSVSHTRQ